ncbi:hypothetical protein GIB67_032847 [Kingdonia uniflora]|uniref:3-hydroxyisobutyrate dehydrogenase-like NAD-binding domain-containing protein n=1 Tax=Kingdonia uniflora TaxID=39325 RepID=A0A7J7NBI0_9MAGN|nr:hypothetical protein GIB67_032847 [Kingdonia uniflora]
MYIVTHIKASLSSFVFEEMEKVEEEVKDGFVLVARKGCFGLPTACSSCLPVYLYLRFANVDFDLHFNLVHPDSAEKNMSSSSLLQGERQGDNASRSSSSSSSSSGSGSSSSVKVYLRDVGNGTVIKLVVNMIMGSMMASFSEGLLLSEKVGLDPKILVKVILGSLARCYKCTNVLLKGPSMVQSKYPTAFSLKHQQKDLRLALGLAESVSHVY